MARRITVDQLIAAHKKRLKGAIDTLPKAIDDVAVASRGDLLELTGANPRGKERRQWLAAMGHPMGRGSLAERRTKYGRKRGPKIGRSKIPALPVGAITFSMRRRIISERRKDTLVVGFGRGQSNWRLVPGGTRKMVDSGMFGVGKSGGEVRKRVRSRMYAVRSHFSKANRKP